MCTVLFIPHSDHYYFASLRDENPKRLKALIPQIYTNNNIDILAPRDGLAGGTWVGVNSFGNVIILLNGGFFKHKQNKKYIKSRGVIVNELLNSIMPIVDWSLINLEGVEPFTLIIWSNSLLFEMVWDGEKKHRSLLETTKNYIWSSSTLYNKLASKKRKLKFDQWISSNPNFSEKTIFEFFASSNDSENGFLINRNEAIKTLSYSFIELSRSNKVLFKYYDLLNDTRFSNILYLEDNIYSCCL